MRFSHYHSHCDTHNHTGEAQNCTQTSGPVPYRSCQTRPSAHRPGDVVEDLVSRGGPIRPSLGAKQAGQLPGAVHLLPLVQFFIGLHCHALQYLTLAKKSGVPGDCPTHTSCVSSGVEASPEDLLCHLESFSVASLSLLQHLVCHSGAVVCRLLSDLGTDATAREGNPVKTCADTTSNSREDAHDQKQHPLLTMLLQLVAFSSTASGHFQASVLSQCLKVLVKLAENASSDFLPRYKDSQEA